MKGKKGEREQGKERERRQEAPKKRTKEGRKEGRKAWNLKATAARLLRQWSRSERPELAASSWTSPSAGRWPALPKQLSNRKSPPKLSPRVQASGDDASGHPGDGEAHDQQPDLRSVPSIFLARGQAGCAWHAPHTGPEGGLVGPKVQMRHQGCDEHQGHGFHLEGLQRSTIYDLHIHTHTHTHMYVCVYIYIYIYADLSQKTYNDFSKTATLRG